MSELRGKTPTATSSGVESLELPLKVHLKIYSTYTSRALPNLMWKNRGKHMKSDMSLLKPDLKW